MALRWDTDRVPRKRPDWPTIEARPATREQDAVSRYARPWTREARPSAWYLVSRAVVGLVYIWLLAVVVISATATP